MPSSQGMVEAVQQGLYEISTSKRAEPGVTYALGDGRVFRYVLAGAADLAPGQLVQNPATVANHLALAIATSPNAGDRQIAVTLGATAATENQYAGGYLIVKSGASGIGDFYKISSHLANAGSGTLIVKLMDPLVRALTAGTHTVSLYQNECSGVIITAGAGAGPTGWVVGVPLRTITAANYGWVQCKGPAPVIQNGALVAGQGVIGALSTGGAVEAPSGTFAVTSQWVGRAIHAGTTAHAAIIDLDLC